MNELNLSKNEKILSNNKNKGQLFKASKLRAFQFGQQNFYQLIFILYILVQVFVCCLSKTFMSQIKQINMFDQANLLKTLYQKKYYDESTLRHQIKQSNMLKMKLNEYRDKIQRISLNVKKQSAPQLLNKKKEEPYNFQYCNQPLPTKLASYKSFVIAKDRKAKSVSCARETTNSNKQNNWIQDLKHSTLHSTRSFYINILGLRKRKYKAQKTLDSDILKSGQNTAREYSKPHIPIYRNTISEVRKRTTMTAIKNRQTNKTHHQHKRDDNDLLPWHVEIEEQI